MHKKPGRCGKSGDWPFLKRKLTRKHPSPPSTTYHNTKSEALQSTSAAAPPQFCNTLPQAIRCLATRSKLIVVLLIVSLFQSPAGDSLSCDRRPRGWGPRRCSRVSIARRRFVVLRPTQTPVARRYPMCFNRPQAIRCLATFAGAFALVVYVYVSIARRRFVVLRRVAHRPGVRS